MDLNREKRYDFPLSMELAEKVLRSFEQLRVVPGHEGWQIQFGVSAPFGEAPIYAVIFQHQASGVVITALLHDYVAAHFFFVKDAERGRPQAETTSTDQPVLPVFPGIRQ